MVVFVVCVYDFGFCVCYAICISCLSCAAIGACVFPVWVLCGVVGVGFGCVVRAGHVWGVSAGRLGPYLVWLRWWSLGARASGVLGCREWGGSHHMTGQFPMFVLLCCV